MLPVTFMSFVFHIPFFDMMYRAAALQAGQRKEATQARYDLAQYKVRMSRGPRRVPSKTARAG